jgi:hypothetical protein
VPYGDIEKTRAAVSDRTAAILVEPIQGEGGVRVPPKGFLEDLSRLSIEKGLLLIMDEVQSGFGRTGKTFAFEHYGVTPDLIACGKGISSSLPLSAVIGRAEIMDLYPPGSMTSTHSASPLAEASQSALMVETPRRGVRWTQRANPTRFKESPLSLLRLPWDQEPGRDGFHSVPRIPDIIRQTKSPKVKTRLIRMSLRTSARPSFVTRVIMGRGGTRPYPEAGELHWFFIQKVLAQATAAMQTAARLAAFPKLTFKRQARRLLLVAAGSGLVFGMNLGVSRVVLARSPTFFQCSKALSLVSKSRSVNSRVVSPMTIRSFSLRTGFSFSSSWRRLRNVPCLLFMSSA